MALAPQPVPAVATVPDTPIWLSILALIAMTMWPSALVWAVQLTHRIGVW
ncbi:MAG TPA: hypothetical protein VNE82_23875 [Candidatus Binataceae bacterium]|nr:hypothetical protein [Candidatus Binataceae bacterium]